MNIIYKTIQKAADSRHGLLLVLSLSVILKGLLFILKIDAVINTDGVYYISAAKQFAAGHVGEGLAIYPMPFYPFVIALAHLFIPDWVVAARLISYICVVSMLIPLYMLTRDLFDRQAAFWASLVFALLPESLRFTLSVMRDPFFFLLFIWAVYFAQAVIRSKRVPHLLAAALCCLFSTFFRLEGIIVFPVYLSVLVILAFVRLEERKDFLRLLAIWFAFFVVLFIPAALVAWHQGLVLNRYGEYVNHLQNTLHVGFLDNFSRISAQLQQMQETAPNSQWGEQFASTAREFIVVIYLLGLLKMFIKVILPVNIIPLIWGFKRSLFQARQIFVLIVALCYLAMVYLFFMSNDFLLSRFLFIPAALVCPWIGLGIGCILDFAKTQRFGGIVLVCVVALVAEFWIDKSDNYFKKRDDLEIQAVSWLAKQHDFEKMKIIFTDPKIAFHTGREISFRGNGDTILYRDENEDNFTDLEQVAAEKRIDLIVVSVDLERRRFLPDLKRYQEIKEFTGRNRSVVVYRSLNHFGGS